MEENLGIQDIIEGCIRQQRQAQKLLYETFAPKLFAVCLAYSHDHAEAEDTLHDGFLKIFTNIKQYKGDGSFEGWLRRIMVNTALEKYRRNHKMMAIAENIRAVSERNIEHVLEELSAKEIMEAVQRLTPQYRLVFMLYAIEGYNHKEIGTMLNISEGTSKSNLSRARAILQERLEQYQDRSKQQSKVIHLA